MSADSLIIRLEGIESRFHDIGVQLSDPQVIGDQKRFMQLNKSYRELEDVVEATRSYKGVVARIAEARDVLANDKDEDFRALAKAELEELEPEIEKLEKRKTEIENLLSSGDPIKSEEIVSLSKELEAITSLIDKKSMRWLELSERAAG